MGILLYWVSIILAGMVKPFAFVFTFYEYFHSVRSWKGFKQACYLYDKHYGYVAYCRDNFANVWAKHFFNRVFILKDGYKFGNRKEPISSALGKNVLIHKLRPLGRLLNWILNKVDPNHSVKNIDSTV